MPNPSTSLALGESSKGIDLRAFASDNVTEVAMPEDVIFGSTDTSKLTASWLSFANRRVILNRGNNAFGTATITATSASTGEVAMLDVTLESTPPPPALDNIRFLPETAS